MKSKAQEWWQRLTNKQVVSSLYNFTGERTIEEMYGMELMSQRNFNSIKPNTELPTPSKDDKDFSKDVFIFAEEGMLNVGYYSFSHKKWQFHTDTLVDPYEGGELMDFVWMYVPDFMLVRFKTHFKRKEPKETQKNPKNPLGFQPKETTYYLFGSDACKELDENGINSLKSEIAQGNIMYGLFKFTEGVTKSVDFISEYDGWEQYSIINFKEYCQLNENITYEENPNDTFCNKSVNQRESKCLNQYKNCKEF